MKIFLILNPHAGNQKKREGIVTQIQDVFGSRADTFDQAVTQFPGHARELSHDAKERGYDLILAAGGDGTVNEVASPLVGSECAFGVIPCGSGNGFARSLGIPASTIKAIEVYRHFRITRIDVGRVESDYFFSTTGVGYDAIIAGEFDGIKNNQRGISPYVVLAVKSYFREKEQHYELNVDGNSFSLNAFAITIANGNQYGAGAKIAPMARMDDGYIDLVCIPKFNLIMSFRLIPRLFTGNLHQDDGITYHRCRVVVINRQQPGHYHIDGEPRDGGKNLHISLLPKALRVIVPRNCRYGSGAEAILP